MISAYVKNTQDWCYIQVRGSVPLFWEQPGLNVGNHKVKLSRGEHFTQTAFEAHFRSLTRSYNNVLILNLLSMNLVGSKEGEAQLSVSYQEQQARSSFSFLTHHLWDFHAEGGGKHLSKLWSRIQSSVEEAGHYTSSDHHVSRVQKAVVRVNCLDCLDRSNVTQVLLSWSINDEYWHSSSGVHWTADAESAGSEYHRPGHEEHHRVQARGSLPSDVAQQRQQPEQPLLWHRSSQSGRIQAAGRCEVSCQNHPEQSAGQRETRGLWSTVAWMSEIVRFH